MTTRTVNLGSIAKITSGGTPDRENPAYWGGTVPWVKTTLVQNCEIGPEDIDEKITEAGLKSSSAKLIPAGSILMAMVGQGKTRGQVAVLATDAAINQNCAAIILSDEANSRYVYQQLLFRYEEIRSASNSSGQQNLNAGLIRELRMPLPSLPEQKRIAEILVGWDTAIQKTEQLIAAKELRYFGLVGRLITGHSKSEAWRHVSIRDIADRVQRQGDGGDYPLLTISSASGFIRQEERYSRYMAGESAKTYTLLRAGEFAYNKGNSKRYEFGCVFQLNGYEAALVPSVYVSFKLHDAVCASYMRHLFAVDYLKPQLRALVKTGVRNNGLLNIRPDEFMGTTVPLPAFEHQLRIANYLDAASAEIDLLKRQLSALRTQKRSLMQKLLTGRWRLPVQEEAN
ncbi:restriction endonuclease subunit S [Methyloversatilis discipulorum]|uniref:restriction endonuclease subunit S n=1 Tax=Methyloversatilis discipulorum TaxID=1119528 RepID=UPI001A43F987|nr:restriction endonuclease subunit S [Methyloversatilis discipulorum]MBL8466319.1 restriction endonuclease subunit S [Methyloversatilis discipulorum]